MPDTKLRDEPKAGMGDRVIREWALHKRRPNMPDLCAGQAPFVQAIPFLFVRSDFWLICYTPLRFYLKRSAMRNLGNNDPNRR